MNNLWLGMKFSLSYFTLLPVRFRGDEELSAPGVLRAMLSFFPLVGPLLAALSISLYLLLEPLGWFAPVAAAVSYMLLYGFLHTEAVIDVADAVHAAHSGKDPYEVIKEPTVGAMGVLYGSGFVILKTAALATLLTHHLFWPFIALAFSSRLGVVWLVRAGTFRSPFVSQLQKSLGWRFLLALSALYAIAGSAFAGAGFLPLLGCGIAATFLFASAMKRSLGFLNGDALGASLEGAELLMMVGVMALWS